MTITKTIDIECTVKRAFEFIANPANWTSYAIHNVLTIAPGENGYWNMETPRGDGQLKIYPVIDLGILDHEFIDANEVKWFVPARVVTTPDGCQLMMTFSKPELMPQDLFEQGMLLLDEELAQLKAILEVE